MASLSLRHIYKIYSGNVKAVSDFNLEIDDKEFIVFVGPSGCGKSTTLRMIAGLEEISAGELYIDGRLVNDVEPKDRDIAMVFQNYALYPHMTVYENMAFGLRLRKMASKEIDDRVKEAAAILGITPLLSRKPKALSGGQRQRVALGRAIVREPKVFLLDEPLSNLDAKLRVQMRTEITKLHNKLATTFIYVTHDQTEAMTMGTRIVVMKDGIVQQVDTPQFLYDSPENKFVASFVGSPQMNFFEHAVLSREDGKMYATFGENKILVPEEKAKRLIDESYIGQEITLGVRPEDIHDEEIFIASSPDTIIKAHVDVVEKLGNETFLYMNVDGKEDYTVARIDARTTIKAEEDVKLAIDAHHLHFFDNKTELTIMGVPKYNMIDADLTANEEGLEVSFGKTKIALGSDVAARLTQPELIGGKVKVGISPDALKTEASEGDVELNVTVDFTEPYPRFTAVYSALEGKSTFLASKHALDADIKAGTNLTYYVNPADVMLFDAATGEKILAYRAVTNNEVVVKTTVKEGIATLAFGKSKLVVSADGFEEGEYAVKLGYKDMECSKEAVAANPRLVVSGVVMDADVLGGSTIIYARVDGVAPYFTAIVPGTPKLNIGDKIKFVVKAENIVKA
ncbi:MAG: sn-glycerol-3-phosphate ABC transporter ATP-binding protein UgpC [Clostridia bacterium]|nr:sn-glycerol-3-phosphate ABC transporter ATP-binding protein UgpC [Clostridia bacterium]